MARFPLDIAPGVVSDDTAFSTKGAWRDADKVRFYRDKPQIIGGWQSLTGEAPVPGVCRRIYPWTDLNNTLNVAFGTNTNLQVFQNGSLYDITPATFMPGQVDNTGSPGYGTGAYGANAYGNPNATTAFPLTWSLSNYGQNLIANPRGQSIFQWLNNTGAVAIPVPNAPANVTFALVMPSRQILAFGCNEEASGNFNPLVIRGSDIADITDWTPTSTNNSFEITLEGHGGRIVGAALISNGVYVWTDVDLFIGVDTGATNQPWQFSLVDSNCGLIGPNAMVVADQTAYWLSPDLQFRSCAYGAEVSQITCPIRDDFADHIDQLQHEKVCMSSCIQFDELRMDYPDTRDGRENSRYLVSNLQGHWSRGQMARTAYVDAGPAAYPIAVTADSFPFYHEIGQSADGGAISWSLTSSDQYLSNADQSLAIMGVWPDIAEQGGPWWLQVNARMYPQGVVRTKGPFSLVAGQHKRDFRATGRIVSMAFSGNSTPAAGRLGLTSFDAVQEGAR